MSKSLRLKCFLSFLTISVLMFGSSIWAQNNSEALAAAPEEPSEADTLTDEERLAQFDYFSMNTYGYVIGMNKFLMLNLDEARLENILSGFQRATLNTQEPPNFQPRLAKAGFILQGALPEGIKEEDVAGISDADALKAYGWAFAMQIELFIGYSESEVEQICAGVRKAMEMRPYYARAMQIHQLKAKNFSQAMEKRDEEIAVENKEASKTYFESLKQKENVQSTGSGLLYEILEEGIGKRVKSDGYAKVHYEGKFLNGQVFDSSYQRGEPNILKVDELIPGFSEGIQLMREGGKAVLHIPAELAYGDKRVQGIIPPESVIVFTVELMEVEPPEADQLKEARGQ